MKDKNGKIHCKNCGNEIEEMSAYCSKCGHRIKKDSIIKRHQIATILSFFIIGLGQIYNRQILKGITFFIIALIFSILSTDKPIFFLITIIIWIYGMYDANGIAKGKDISIMKRLGKIGIPGFRSGKKWKMVIAVFGYFWIFLILLLIISNPSNKYENSVLVENNKQQTTEISSNYLTEDDVQFFKIMDTSVSDAGLDSKGITDALNEDDEALRMVKLVGYSERMTDNSEKYIASLEKLNVSTEFKDIYYEFHEYIADNKEMGSYFTKAANYGMQGNDEGYIYNLNKASEKTNEASNHLKTVNAYTKILLQK